jgi:Velvet factor
MTVTLTDIAGNVVRIQNREHQMTPVVGVSNTSFHRITMPRTENEHLHDIIPVFAFTDLSVRQEGVFKLRFNLFELTSGMSIHRAEAYSREFQVFSAKNFPGMEPSTPFTECLKKHGLRVRVSKSIRTAKSHARVLKLDHPVKGDHEGHSMPRHTNYHPYVWTRLCA